MIENAENIGIANSWFDSVGGNGVALSKHAANCTIKGNRFSFPGDSGVVMIGVSNMADGTADTNPVENVIESNWFHDIGSFGKQISCVFQAVSGRNTIRNNICVNGPRAGININDGFMGGNLIEGNLVANMVRHYEEEVSVNIMRIFINKKFLHDIYTRVELQVRETSDHGPINTWDRTPYATIRKNGTILPYPDYTTITRNLIVNGHNGVWTLDHDDGSSYYNDTTNVLFYGGCKNFRGNNKICGPNNLIIFPGIDSRAQGARSCQTNDNGGYCYDSYIGNDCIQGDGNFYTFNGNITPSNVPFTANNRFYSTGGVFSVAGHNLTYFQSLGLDVGSTVKDIPSIPIVKSMALSLLEL